MLVEIVTCPTVRELSGLALSSRNQYLTATEKEQATVLFKGLRQAEAAFRAGVRNSSELIALARQEIAQVSNISLEYIELVEPNTLMFLEKVEDEGMLAIAARLGSTRLIDNTILRDVNDGLRQPIIANSATAQSSSIAIPCSSTSQVIARYIAPVSRYTKPN